MTIENDTYMKELTRLIKKVAKEYKERLHSNLIFNEKLSKTHCEIKLKEDRLKTSNAYILRNKLKNEYLIHFDINPMDSETLIAIIIAHEFAHLLFKNHNDLMKISDLGLDGSTGYTAIIRRLPNGDKYGVELEELLCNYLAYFIVSKMEFSDEKVLKKFWNSHNLYIADILQNSFGGGKSLLECEYIDEYYYSKKDRKIEYNYFWNCILMFSFHNVMMHFERIMGKQTFQKFCDLFDQKNISEAEETLLLFREKKEKIRV